MIAPRPFPGSRSGDLGQLLAEDGNLLVLETFLIQPVGAPDFPERIERCLNSFRPGHRDQLDVPVHIANGKDPGAARLVVRIDGDTSVLLELHAKPLESLLPRHEANLDDHDGDGKLACRC